MVDPSPSSAPRVLVVGATGLVGREVVTALCARGLRPRVLLRAPDRASALPPGAEVEVVVGDLDNRSSLDSALEGVDAAFLTTPHDEREAELGLAFLAACEHAKVTRLVLSSAIHPDSSNRLVRDAIFRVMGKIGPHYAAKYRVEAAVRDSHLDTVVLQPTNFYQNDLLWQEELLTGSYPQPLGAKGANRVDCRDIGEAAARGLLAELPGGAYPLVGPAKRLSGPESAAVWARVLGREVAYAGDDLDTWEQAVGERMAPRMRADFRATYGLIQRFGLTASARQLDATRTALGREPQDYETFVRATIEQWSS